MNLSSTQKYFLLQFLGENLPSTFVSFFFKYSKFRPVFEKERVLTRFSNPKTVDTLSELVSQIWNILLPSGLLNSFPLLTPNNKYIKKQIHHNLRYLYFPVYTLIMLILWFVSTSGYLQLQNPGKNQSYSKTAPTGILHLRWRVHTLFLKIFTAGLWSLWNCSATHPKNLNFRSDNNYKGTALHQISQSFIHLSILLCPSHCHHSV